MLVVPRADFVDALDSDRYRIQWITGAYVLGSAWGMAMTSFAGSRIGLRLAYLLGVVLFTLAGTGCSLVTEVVWMAPVRLVQGFGNGLIISVGMVSDLACLHRSQGAGDGTVRHGDLCPPALAGAMLGGLLTTLLSWRLIFVLILPLGGLAALAAWMLLPADRPKERHAAPLDFIGLALLLSWITTMSVVLDMGQYWGWLASPYFAPWFLGLIGSFAGFVLWGILAPAPLINLRVLARRSFVLGLGIKALFSINLIVLVSLLANYMVNLRGYQWWQASLVVAPAAATMLASILCGTYLGRDGNRKWRLFIGLAVMAAATSAFMAVDLYTAKGLLACTMAVWGLGAGLVVGPRALDSI